jgi:hypothetical protein
LIQYGSAHTAHQSSAALLNMPPAHSPVHAVKGPTSAGACPVYEHTHSPVGVQGQHPAGALSGAAGAGCRQRNCFLLQGICCSTENTMMARCFCLLPNAFACWLMLLRCHHASCYLQHRPCLLCTACLFPELVRCFVYSLFHAAANCCHR